MESRLPPYLRMRCCCMLDSCVNCGRFIYLCLSSPGETSWSRCNRMACLPGPRRQKSPPFTVGRGPVPRHRPRTSTLAGDRPPRYGRRKSPVHRRARACPSPCPDLRSKQPGSRGCGHFPQRLRDRGGNPLGCAYGIRGPPPTGGEKPPSP